MKVCKRCGKQREDTDYRLYPANAGYQPGARYAVCEVCQRIERRRRYLERTAPDSGELAKINQLYDMYRVQGIHVPGDTERLPIDELLKEVQDVNS